MVLALMHGITFHKFINIDIAGLVVQQFHISPVPVAQQKFLNRVGEGKRDPFGDTNIPLVRL